MNIRRQKKFAVSYMIIGAVIFIAMTVFGDTEGYTGGIISGMGASMFFVGLVRLVQVFKLSSDPEKAANYEAAFSDERLVYISNKARSLSFIIMTYAELIAGLIASLILDQKFLGQVLFIIVSLQCLLFAAIYRIYQKKY